MEGRGLLLSTMIARRKSGNKKACRKKGQAIIETIFLLPFIIAVLFFIYQAYLVVNKVQVVQKYLKGGIIGKIMNRNVITVDVKCDELSTPPDGRYFVIFNEKGTDACNRAAADKRTNIDIGDTAITMLSYFCPRKQKPAFRSFIKGQTVGQALGVCMGASSKSMGIVPVPSDVLRMKEGDVCLKQ